MSAAESSILLNGVLPSMTTAANLVADKTIEFLKQQQEQLQRQLLKQEILNTNLYQSLIDSGVIPAVRTTTSSTSNLLELLKNRSLLNGLSKTDDNQGSGSSSASSAFNSAPNLANLASILPLSDAFTSLGTVFEKLFGTKFWIYILFALLIGTGFLILSCLFMYCCCCNRFGKVLCCCRFGSWFGGGGSRSSKKSKKKQALEDASKIKCCV